MERSWWWIHAFGGGVIWTFGRDGIHIRMWWIHTFSGDGFTHSMVADLRFWLGRIHTIGGDGFTPSVVADYAFRGSMRRRWLISPYVKALNSYNHSTTVAAFIIAAVNSIFTLHVQNEFHTSENAMRFAALY